MSNRSVLVRLRAQVSDYNRGLASATTATRAFVKELDTSNNQTSMLVQSLMAIAPAVVPLGGAATVALSSLASSLAFTAGAGATAAIAFQGVGDALDALNDYQLEPSAKNLAKVKEEFDKLGPAGQEFVVFLQELRPQMQEIQDLAQEGWFPGLQDGIESALEQMPVFERIVSNTAEALGRLSADAGEAFTDPFWTEFFEFIEAEAAPSIDVFFRSMGNVTEALAGMWMAMEPINNDFAEGMLDATERFAKWAAELDESQGFQHFVEYIRDTGPQVLDTLGGLGNAFVALIRAMAPLGGPTLQIIETLADTIAVIADSPAGPVLIATASGLAAISRAIALYNIANGSALAQFIGKAGEDGKKAIPALRGVSAAIGTLALSLTDVDDKMGLSNTATLAMMGTIAGPWGTAIGAAAGLTMDLAGANNDLTDAVKSANEAMRGTDVSKMETELERLRGELAETDQAAQNALNADSLVGLFRDDTDYENWADFLGGQIERRISGTKDLLVVASDRFSGAYREGQAEAERLQQRIRDLENGAGDVSDVMGSALAPALGVTAEGFDIATLAADDFIASLEDVQATLEGRANWRDYQAALDEAAEIFTERADIQSQIGEARGDLAAADTAGEREAAQQRIEDLQAKLKELAVTLDTATEAGRENEANLDTIATTALKFAESLEGMERVEFLKQARKDFIQAAVDLRMPRKEAQELATDLGLVNEVRVKPKVDTSSVDEVSDRVDKTARKLRAIDGAPAAEVELEANDNANPFIELVRSNLRDLDGDSATVTIRTRNIDIRMRGAAAVHESKLRGDEYAAGGVRYRQFAAGDVANAHAPELAGPGKTVRIWREEETGGESYIPHADDWRRPRAIRIWEETGKILGVNFQRYATGGVYQPAYAPATPATVGGFPAIDYDRLSAAMLNARPLYGPVTVQGDGSFRREMEQDARNAAMGGVTRGGG